MADADDNAPLYFVEELTDGQTSWRVRGPNGPVGMFASARDAQAKADFLNEQVAEASEDDA